MATFAPGVSTARGSHNLLRRRSPRPAVVQIVCREVDIAGLEPIAETV
jgi:hypothetical protein